MRRKVYIDCGTHLGEGMAKHIKEFNIDESWTIFTFEANTHTFNILQEARKLENIPYQYRWVKWNNIEYFNKAVWVNDGTVDFYCSTVSNSDTKNHPEYINFIKFHDELLKNGDLLIPHQRSDYSIDGSSTLFPDKYSKFLNNSGNALERGLNWNIKITVESFDFSKWLKDTIHPDDYVICKLDVEGAEYEVLKKCIKDGTIQLLDKLDAEFHPYSNENAAEDTAYIMSELNKNNVSYRWW